jgi:hypothetical protein
VGIWRDRVLLALTSGQVVRYAFKGAGKAGLVPLRHRYRLGLVDRPAYAYGLELAAIEARKLGHAAMTAIEFGVGAGNGLLAMEEHAEVVKRLTGVDISVVGFDTGEGLPAPVDFRDLPYLWEGGFYPMDKDLLRSRLYRAELVLGDVRSTAAEFAVRADQSKPIGFVSFDLDYWSSTIAAFDIFRGEARVCLPRVWCYFDDIAWTVEDVGELRATREFNEEPHGRRIRPQFMRRSLLPFQPVWADQIFQAHLFDHQDYGVLLTDREAGRVTLGDRWT